MDLQNLNPTMNAEKGAQLILRSPLDNQPIIDEVTKQPVTITLLGRDSETYRKIERRHASEKVEGATRLGRLRITADQLEQERLELIVACTRDWSGVILKGETLACTPDNARKLYSEIPWVREQAEQFINDRAAYLGN